MPEPITLIGVGGGTAAILVNLARRYFDQAKEVMDVLAGAALLLVTAPVMLFCVLLIKLSGRGPVIFTQVRLGKGGKPFRMYKLRTMFVGAETGSGAVWAAARDPRVMPLCRWMRRCHLDEVPQLINIIKGDMSLVGPRPERPEIMAELEKVYPQVSQRLAVRPGLTGLAQVRNGYDTSVQAFRRKLEADLEYIDRRAWGLELAIMAKTVLKLNDKTAH